MADNRNLSTGTEERLTSGWWVLLSLLVPLALFHSLRYEISFMVGNTSLDKVPPGCSNVSGVTHFLFSNFNLLAMEGLKQAIFGPGFMRPFPMWGEQCTPEQGCSVTQARCSSSSAASCRWKTAHVPVPPYVEVCASGSQWIHTCHSRTRLSPQDFFLYRVY